uniref:C2H2-type domain-containing protein n=1 Tax=Denticeps clupeoides TaxID=299321 RepID=A0AAY4A451_9TELE
WERVLVPQNMSRLGKRSTMGALVCGPCPSEESHADLDAEGGVSTPGVRSGHHGTGRVKLHPGQKVFVHCAGQECGGVVEQHNHVDNQVSIFLPQLNQHILRKLEDVWMSPSNPPHSVSCSIDVPKRNPEAVDMDEMMAAMVLTSLSCSPAVQSPSQAEPAAAPSGMECGGGELSDSGSSGCWSWDHGNASPAPSPPITETDRSLAAHADEGLDMELDQVLFDEPAPRKRKNSLKVAYRCLWRNCGKVLTTVVGIKRHIRTLHLGQNSESDKEEDFYYTEVYRDVDQPTPAASPPSPPRHAAPSPKSDQPSTLSQSAPGSFWQVHSEHSYQAHAPVEVVVPAVPVPSTCRWTPTFTIAQSKQGEPFRSRSTSVGEQWLQSHSAPTRTLPGNVSPPRSHFTSRKIRGEAKKCRKVYGIEHRDQWCTACRWKKACQRFVD